MPYSYNELGLGRRLSGRPLKLKAGLLEGRYRESSVPNLFRLISYRSHANSCALIPTPIDVECQ